MGGVRAERGRPHLAPPPQAGRRLPQAPDHQDHPRGRVPRATRLIHESSAASVPRDGSPSRSDTAGGMGRDDGRGPPSVLWPAGRGTRGHRSSHGSSGGDVGGATEGHPAAQAGTRHRGPPGTTATRGHVEASAGARARWTGDPAASCAGVAHRGRAGGRAAQGLVDDLLPSRSRRSRAQGCTRPRRAPAARHRGCARHEPMDAASA